MIIVDEKQYRKAFKEVLVILDFIPKEDYNKIPKNIILILKKFQDNSYNYNLDFNKEFKEQSISDITKAILSNFYRDYWAKYDEKNRIIDKENIERIRKEDEKRQKYNPDNIFKMHDTKENVDKYQNISIDKSLVIKEKVSILRKILKKVKRLLNKEK